MLSDDDQRDLQKSLKYRIKQLDNQRELLKSFKERIKQLRMYDGILDDVYDDDEEPDVFIGDGI
jgi:hypothetical protein